MDLTGRDLYLSLRTVPGIPGNGVAIPGQELISGQMMYMAMVPPSPEDGKQETIDILPRPKGRGFLLRTTALA